MLPGAEHSSGIVGVLSSEVASCLGTERETENERDSRSVCLVVVGRAR